jgi:hypothetical protein
MEVAGGSAIAAVRATAKSNAVFISHSGGSYGASGGGGGMVSVASYRQTFVVAEVIVGSALAGETNFEYGFVDMAVGFPKPETGSAIPAGAQVILLLTETGHVIKDLPDTEPNRKQVVEFIPSIRKNAAAYEAFQSVLAQIDQLSISVRYTGPGGPPLYKSVTLEVPPVRTAGAVPLQKEQAARLIDWLARAQFFKRAERITDAKPLSTAGPGYELGVSAGPKLRFRLDLGWDRQTHSTIWHISYFSTDPAKAAVEELLKPLEALRDEGTNSKPPP